MRFFRVGTLRTFSILLDLEGYSLLWKLQKLICAQENLHALDELETEWGYDANVQYCEYIYQYGPSNQFQKIELPLEHPGFEEDPMLETGGYLDVHCHSHQHQEDLQLFLIRMFELLNNVFPWINVMYWCMNYANLL